MGTGNWGPSGSGRLFPLLFVYMKKIKQLDIFIDESGDFSAVSKENPLYSISFVLVENDVNNESAINKYYNFLNSLFGGNHFVHVGNLIRAEKPYEEMQREERWKLFYTLFLLALNARYKVFDSTVIKSETEDKIISSIAKSIINSIEENKKLLKKYKLVLHYDFGQGSLAGIITTSFLSVFPNCEIIKTTQSENPFMQVADLFAYIQLLKYKIEKGYLTKSENKFFGGIKNLKNNYIKALNKKYLNCK